MLTLFAPKKTKLPKWFFQASWPYDTLFKSTSFLPTRIGINRIGDLQLLTSSPERALLELIYLIPNNANIEDAYRSFKKLIDIDVHLMQALLEKCTSNRVKKVFLYFVEKANPLWRKKIDIKKINLGEGTIVVEKPGRHHSKYKMIISDISDDPASDKKYEGIALG